jgi:Tol biopolymer transport system component
MKRRLHAFSALAVTVACSALAVPAAEASLPGRNGLIAFTREVPPFDIADPVERIGASTIWTADPGSGRTRQLTHVPRRCGSRGWTWEDRQPAFSASGRLLVYRHEDACDPSTPDGFFVMSLDGDGRRRIPISVDWTFLSFSPSDRLLAFADSGGKTFIAPARRPSREREVVLPERYDEVAHPAWSSTGRLALTLAGVESDGLGHIGSVAPSGKDLSLVTRSKRDAMPDWSPTADQIVFQREKYAVKAPSDVLVARAHGRGRKRRLTHTRDAVFPVWSPGRAISPMCAARCATIPTPRARSGSCAQTTAHNNGSW